MLTYTTFIMDSHDYDFADAVMTGLKRPAPSEPPAFYHAPYHAPPGFSYEPLYPVAFGGNNNYDPQ